MPILAKQWVHFGPFELDAHAGELYKHGLKLKLQGHPIQILAMLLERPGELVTREEIQQKLWPSESETFVDFEHGLNTAVRKLRQALGDEAETPQFIETLPRRGYRFVGEIAAQPEPAEPTPGSESGSSTDAGADAKQHGELLAVHSPALSPVLVSERVRRSRAIWVTVLVTVVLSIAGVLVRSAWRGLHTPEVVRTKRLTFNEHVGPGGVRGTVEVYDSIQTDGRRIYYTVEDEQPLRYVSVNGGDGKILATPLFPVILHLSPDASTLLIKAYTDANGSTESQIWMMRVNDGSAIRLGEIKAQDAAFAPDGKTIVFAKGEELYVTDLQGNTPAKLATVPGRAFWLRWSPNGKKLRFSVVDPKKLTYTLWELPSSGSMHQLLVNWGKDSQVCCGEWASTGEYFIFRKIGNINQTWMSHEQGLLGWAEDPILLSASGMELGAAVPSPFEEKLYAIGGTHNAEMLVRDPQSGELSLLEIGQPAWRVAYSRDGTMLAVLGETPEGGALWRVSADGREKQQLTFPPLDVHRLAYSPNQRIAIMARWPDQPWKIYWIAAEGGSLHELSSDVVNQADPTWSPDGQSILFGQPPVYRAQPSIERNLYLYDLRSGKTSKLPDTTGLFSPRWSPDGRYVAALTIDEHALVVLDMKTGQRRQLDREQTIDNPFWSRDSQWIYFNSSTSARGFRFLRAVWRLNALDGRLEPLTVKVDPLRCSTLHANGMRPDGWLLFTCSRIYRDIYELEWKK